MYMVNGIFEKLEKSKTPTFNQIPYLGTKNKKFGKMVILFFGVTLCMDICRSVYMVNGELFSSKPTKTSKINNYLNYKGKTLLSK